MNDLEEKQSEGLPAVLESLNKFAETQALEVEIKRQELVVKEKEIESNERIALKSIDVQAAAQATKYDKFNKHLIHRYVFIGCIVLMILTFAQSLVQVWASLVTVRGDAVTPSRASSPPICAGRISCARRSPKAVFSLL